MSSRSQYDVFLSYARTDDQDGAIRGLAEEMRDVFYRRTDHELRIFVDHRDIRVSEAWRQKIEDALRSSTVIVPVVTRAYLKSDWCRREWNYFAGVRSLASDPDLHLIYPVLLDGIPQLVKSEPAREWLDEVSSLEYVDLRGSGSGTQRHAAQVARLMDSVMTALHQVNAQESTSAQSTEEQHLDALTGYVRDRSRFVHLLAEALNVTIIGLTNETLAEILQKALDRKRAISKNENDFWRSLRIVFLADEMLDSIKDVRADVPDGAEALRRRRLAARYGRRSVSLFLERIPSSHWELYESRYHLPLSGSLFEMSESRPIVQLRIPRSQRRTRDQLYMEFRDRDDQYYTGAFADIIQNSTSLQTIIPVGVPQGGGVLRCTETRFRENVLVSGSNESGWLPVVLVVTWRPRGGRPELWLQLRTADNCHREWNRLAHLSSYIFQDDILAGGGGPPGDTAEFDLSEAMVAAAARRCLRMEIDEKPQQVLAPVSSRGYVYPDKENLFFYIFSVELPSHREFPQEAEMRQAPIRTLLTIREGQAVRSALRLCKQKRRPKPIPRAAAEIAALNLTLHGHRDLADDLQTAANQRTGLDRLSRRIAQLDDQIREARRGEDGDVQVAGLAGFQYREFFTMLLPLYADIGVDGASDALAIVREDRVRREAMSRLAALYADENAMATVPSTYGM